MMSLLNTWLTQLNMPAMINITNEDIEFAERILLKEKQHFDAERVDFIKNLNTIDLQAVPGSGKTTALLAKLLILERYMPLEEGCGVLVISHTNAAVDEVKERIGKYCPKLFSYPNFIGTIQGFVDTFLAIPFYTNKYGKKPSRIDSEAYNERLSLILSKPWLYKFGLSGDDFKKINYLKNVDESIFYKYRFGFNNENRLILIKSLNGEKLEIKKPRRGSNYKDYSEEEKARLNKWFIKLKIYLMTKQEVLHYDDAYFLANCASLFNPKIKKLLQLRFKYVFVDEMQDMDTHQHDLIEKVFYPDESTQSVIQRIGDKNQAIYNGGSVQLDNIWSTRENVLYINGSHRLSPKIATLVQNLALTPNPVDGKNKNADGSIIDINPTILIYQDTTKTLVISAFADKIKALQNIGAIPINPPHKFMAIAWRKEHEDPEKIGLSDYWANFSNANSKKQIDFNVLKDYILYCDKEKGTLEPIRKNILNAFLKILRLESVFDEHSRFFTKRKLINLIKTLEDNEYENLKLKLYKWSLGTIKGNSEEIITSIREYIPSFLSIFQKTINLSTDFINGGSEINVVDLALEAQSNLFESEELSIEIGTVHSAKGQTHTATLYLETYFQKDGNGANAKSYESQRLARQILGNQLAANVGARVKQSAKMAYVGFSRPTHLLCLAVHKDRFDAVLSGINRDDWDIVEVE
jgi:DNA helicase-2/ATP-dependent DNA helicase PcrA